MDEKKYDEVADGVYTCRVVSVSDRKVWKDGEAVDIPHKILRIGLVPVTAEDGSAVTGDNTQIYNAELPLIYMTPEPWKFYDKAQNKSVERATKDSDSVEAIDRAKKLFPEWAAFLESGNCANLEEAFGWFNSEAFTQLAIKAKIANRSYTGADGQQHVDHQARFIGAGGGSTTADKWNKQLEVMGKKLIKLGGKPKAAAPSSAAVPTTEGRPLQKAPAPKPMPKPVAKPKDATQDEVWDAYQKKITVDPEGAKFWDFVSESVGRDCGDGNVTAAEWGACLAKLA